MMRVGASNVNVYRIVNVESAQTMQVVDGGQDNAVNIAQGSYSGLDFQNFELELVGGLYKLKATHSDKYLDVAGG